MSRKAMCFSLDLFECEMDNLLNANNEIQHIAPAAAERELLPFLPLPIPPALPTTIINPATGNLSEINNEPVMKNIQK